MSERQDNVCSAESGGSVRPAIALYALCIPAAFAEVPIGTSLTIILDFRDSHSEAAVQMMQSEVTHLLRRTSVRIDFALRSEVKPYQDFEDLVFVRFHGDCREGLAPLMDERGPLAWSHAVEGSILPFGDVSCAKVRRAIESALYGQRGGRARELLFGRALGRVLSHELYHIIGGTHRHGKKGIAQPSLSPQELVADEMEIESEDVQRMLAQLRQRTGERRQIAARWHGFRTGRLRAINLSLSPLSRIFMDRIGNFRLAEA
jgi:hypothetical protein